MSNEIVGGEIKMEADRLWQQMADELYRLRAERNKLRAALEDTNAALQHAEYPKIQDALRIIRKALA